MPSQFFVKRANFTTVCSRVCIIFTLVWLAFACLKPKKWIGFVATAVPLYKMVMTSFSLPAVCCYLNWCYLLESVVLDLLFIICVQTCTIPLAVFSWSMYWKNNFVVYCVYLYIVPVLDFLKLLKFLLYILIVCLLLKHSVDLSTLPVTTQLEHCRNYNRLITFFFHKEDQLNFLIWETIIIVLKVFVHSSSCKQLQEQSH